MMHNQKMMSVEEIQARHQALSAQQQGLLMRKERMNESTAEVMDNKERFNIIWMRVKKMRAEMENIKTLVRTLPVAPHTIQLGQFIAAMDDSTQKAHNFLRDLMEDYQMRGKTGEFDLQSVQAAIAQRRQQMGSSPDGSPSTPVPPATATVTSPTPTAPTQQPSPTTPTPHPLTRERVQLKPIGQTYRTGSRELVLATNKIDDRLYLVDLTNKKVVAQPHQIQEVHTDEARHRIIALATTADGARFFIDTLNKSIVSGPLSGFTDILMIHRHQNVLFTQVVNEKGARFYLNVDTGAILSDRDLYQLLR